MLFEFPDHMIKSKAYLDPANFYITNSNPGRPVSAKWLEDRLRDHQHKRDGSLHTFLAKHLNVEMRAAQAALSPVVNLRSDRWAAADVWEQAAIPVFSIDKLITRSEILTASINGGGGGGARSCGQGCGWAARCGTTPTLWRSHQNPSTKRLLP